MRFCLLFEPERLIKVKSNLKMMKYVLLIDNTNNSTPFLFVFFSTVYSLANIIFYVLTNMMPVGMCLVHGLITGQRESFLVLYLK